MENDVLYNKIIAHLGFDCLKNPNGKWFTAKCEVYQHDTDHKGVKLLNRDDFSDFDYIFDGYSSSTNRGALTLCSKKYSAIVGLPIIAEPFILQGLTNNTQINIYPFGDYTGDCISGSWRYIELMLNNKRHGGINLGFSQDTLNELDRYESNQKFNIHFYLIRV